MKINKAFKFSLYSNSQQKQFLEQSFGCARFVYNQAIYIESLAIRNVIQNHCLAKSISDSGWNTFVNMLKYKGQWYGCRIIEIDRWFPSSKRCHVCGYINDNLILSDRYWFCPECNTNHDRDVNADINIQTFGRAGIARTLVSSSLLGETRNACGEGSPQLSSVSLSLKQEAPSEFPVQEG